MTTRLSAAGLGAVLVFGGACKMSNPAFETGEESDSRADLDDTQAGDGDGDEVGSSTAGDGDATGDGDGDTTDATGDGDGDTTGDGDGDTTGDGDGDSGTSETTGPGDGDGDGDSDVPPCGQGEAWVQLPLLEDSFVMTGPGGQDNCTIDTEDGGDPWVGPPSVACGDLNFGSTGILWVGGGNNGTAHLLLRFGYNVPDRENLQISQARFGIRAADGDPMAPERELALFLFGPADSEWQAGVSNGTYPTSEDVTYHHRKYPATQWSGGWIQYALVSESLGKVYFSGGPEDLSLDVDLMWMQTQLGDLAVDDNAFLLTADTTAAYTTYVHASEGEMAPTLSVLACLSG